MNAVDLARAQFALTANVHFLFVLLTLGLVPVIAGLQTRYALTGRADHARMVRFWGQLYVTNYGVGIVTGLVMEFQFGLDWSGVSRVAGQVFGAPLTLETIVAFFAEATFLGMWVFGWNLLPRLVHLVLFYLVAVTAFGSAYFVMVANGFLQHPVGYRMSGGTATSTDFGAVLTNPTALLALGHIAAAALLTGGVVVAGVSGRHLRRGTTEFLGMLRLGAALTVVGGVATVVAGFRQLDWLHDGQPEKYRVLSGTSSAGAADAPPGWVAIAFHAMQGIGIACAAVAVLASPLLFSRWILRHNGMLRVVPWLVPLPFIASICGWLVREIGRQPWVIYGVLKSPNALGDIGVGQVACSLSLFGAIVLGLGLTNWRLLARLAQRGLDGMVLGATVAEIDDDEALAGLFDEPATVAGRG
jgi:cytochrome d ubiquinol oxidase subunit I